MAALQSERADKQARLDSLLRLMAVSTIGDGANAPFRFLLTGRVRDTQVATSPVTTVPSSVDGFLTGGDETYLSVVMDNGVEGWIESTQPFILLGEATSLIELMPEGAARKKLRGANERRLNSIAVKETAGQQAAEREALWTEKGIPVYISNVLLGTNSVGGVDVSLNLTNISSKDIDYVSATFVGFNSVGDVVPGRIRGETSHLVRMVGPLAPGEDGAYSFDAAWYGGTTTCLELRRVAVEYRDDSTYTMVNDLEDLKSQGAGIAITGDCSRR